MPVSEMPPRFPSSSPKKGSGYLRALLIGALLLFVGLPVTVCCTALYTAVPIRILAWLAESIGSSAGLQITGISGNLSSGFGCSAINWENGEVSDLRFRYHTEARSPRRSVIIDEIHAGRAHADFSGWTHANFLGAERTSNNPDSNIPKGSRMPFEWPFGSLTISNVSLGDILLTNRRTGFELAIPSLQWTGFRVAPGEIEPGAISIVSDRLQLSTQNSEDPKYQKRLEAVLFPKLHPSLRKSIPISADLAFSGNTFALRLNAFEGGLKAELAPGHDGFVRAQKLHLGDYFHAPLPRDISCELLIPSNSNLPTALQPSLSSGSFQLGTRTFHVDLWDGASHPEGWPIAVSRGAPPEFSYTLSELKPFPKQVLLSHPSLSPEETLALIFFGRFFAELPPSDQQEVHRITPFFRFSISKE
jgi:hypothetical protein